MPRSTVVIELASDGALARDLAAGGVFVPGCALQMADECELVVCGANRRISVPARVVYVDEHRGAGLELIGFSTRMRDQLAEIEPIGRSPAVGDSGAPGAPARPADEDDLAVPVATDPGDDDRTIPVPVWTGVHDVREPDRVPPAVAGAAGDAAPDDDLAVPIATSADDDHLTIPISTGVHSAARVELAPPVPSGPDRSEDGLALPVASGGEPAPPHARRATSGPPVESDPALAITEADAAFFDAASAVTAPAAGDPDRGFFDPVSAESIPATAGHGFVETAALDPATDAGAADAEPIATGAEPAEHEPEVSDAPDTPDAPEGDPPEADATGDRRSAQRAPRNVHERLRGLPLAAQLKLAASGELHERIVLERLYGKNVWETLLRNPRLTPPEVSRIARYGVLPRVLLEIILANNAWLAVPEVRRALLSNPRLPTDQMMKVLRLVPKHELRLAAIQTAYPQAVRSAARMLLGGE